MTDEQARILDALTGDSSLTAAERDAIRVCLAERTAAVPVLAAAVALMHSTVGDSYVQAFDALSVAVQAWEQG